MRKFSTNKLCILALCSVINLIGGQIALLLRFPIYLDSFGAFAVLFSQVEADGRYFALLGGSGIPHRGGDHQTTGRAAAAFYGQRSSAAFNRPAQRLFLPVGTFHVVFCGGDGAVSLRK